MLIDGSDGFTVLASYKNCDNVTDEVKAWNPDVILMDIDMPGTNGIEGLKLIRSQNSTVKILMLTVFDDDDKIFDAIRAGAVGYFLKDEKIENIIQGIQLAFQNIYNHDLPLDQITLAPTRKEFQGTYTFVVFPFLKILFH